MALPANFPFPAEQDKANNIKVRADHFDANMEYLIALINNCLSRFGANQMQGNIDANNKTFNNLATPMQPGDAANKQYVDGKITQITSLNPLIAPALLQLATQDETLAGVVTNKAVSPAALSLAISSAISAASTNLPYDFLGGFDLSFSNGTQITIGTGQAASSDNTRNLISDFVANKDILTLWAPSNGQSTVVGCKPANVTINLWNRYNIFAISTEPVSATRGTFTTSDISANVDNFKGVSNGFLRVVIDGVNHDLTGLDFSNILSISDIAQVIKSSLSGADVNATAENQILFTSATTGATSSVNLATVPAGVGTDITTSNYLNITEGTAENGSNYIYSIVDFGIDNGTTFNAANLLATSGAAYQAGFRNYRYIGYLIVGGNNQIFSITGAAEEERFNQDREYRVGDFADNVRLYLDGQVVTNLNQNNFYRLKKGYLPCTGNLSVGYINGNYYVYWGTDGVRRFMLPDSQLYDKLGPSTGYGQISIQDSITSQTITARKLPDFNSTGAFRRAFGGPANGIGTIQQSGAPNITGGRVGVQGLDVGGFDPNALTEGALYAVGGANYSINSTRNSFTVGVAFDASRSSSVYQNGLTEVRPINYSCWMFIAY